jgi:NAD(P)-dependent dehydrogenase (short-subunit alcohol dehydrogenase family)
MAGVAIVTGASRGIGRGIALGLGEAGWIVYVTGREVRTLDATAADVTRRGGQGVAIACDHRIDSQTAGVFRAVDHRDSRLDLLVNNATAYTTDVGPPAEGTFWEQPVEIWDLMMTVGLRSHFVASVGAARMMVPKRGGLIVNVSSAGAVRPGRNVPYNVVKAGVDMLTQGTAKQLREHNVAVVSVWPHLTRTEGVVAHPEMFPDLSGASTPEFNGRVVAALAADPEVMAKTGRALDMFELAAEYGVSEGSV